MLDLENVAMNEMQKKLLNMMKWFHNFCVEEDLCYYAIGGTALGAVRHKGFIPWDDDIDVGMPRPDYEKMIDAFKNKKNTAHYILDVPLEKKDNIYPFCKLYDTNTTLIENVRIKVKRGIYIDIFPLDGIGNTISESHKNYKHINFWIDMLNTKICALRKGRSIFKNFSIIVGRAIPEFILGRTYLIEKINNMGKRLPYNDNSFAVNLFGAWKEREIIKREWLGKPQLCEFEDMQIYIPENSHDYLTSLYGNYMELPPVEKRVSHHDFIECDLEKSYL